MHTTLSKVPRLNLKAIREALKANGITLLDATYTLDVRCDACGAYNSVDASLQFRLHKTWWHCWKCHERARNEFRVKVARDDGFWVQGTLHPW